MGCKKHYIHHCLCLQACVTYNFRKNKTTNVRWKCEMSTCILAAYMKMNTLNTSWQLYDGYNSALTGNMEEMVSTMAANTLTDCVGKNSGAFARNRCSFYVLLKKFHPPRLICYSPSSKCTRIGEWANIFIKENAFENVVCKIWSISSRS